MSNLHQTDFYQWTREQVELLRRNQFRRLDLQNLIEAVDDLGRGQLEQLECHLTRILVLLLKWQIRAFREDLRTMHRWYQSWFMVIEYGLKKERAAISQLLMKNPSLFKLLEESVLECYPIACQDASKELEIPVEEFPDTNPWSLEQLISDDFPGKGE
ncbi:DUF29 domain-containing protein [Endozoicomonas ascidiicola]|uniref:DUF29 domain-containing protein n=1 Tax=Endozoicomonas ascidiicola TaxID=1698521 RepID=UPI00082E966A|nr:DUF29 domain-containing protein [Endozoicomonas ascidiicola]